MPSVNLEIFLFRILTLAILMGILGPWFHELSHWAFARTQTEEMEIHRSLWVIASGVEYREVDDFSDRALRFTALAPQIILLLPVTIYYVLFGTPPADGWVIDGAVRPLIKWALFFSALAGGIVISPADLIAIFCQREFRNWEELGLDEQSHIGLAKFLINCLQRGRY